MVLTRRKLFKSGLLLSLFSGVPFFSLKGKNIKLVRTFYYPLGADSRLSSELKTYMDHEALYFLDADFQLRGKLLSVSYAKSHSNHITVTRIFDNQVSCEEWRELYKEKCVLDHANLTLFSHRLKEEVLLA